MSDKINFTRIKHDACGNPRYVCDFYALLTKKESERPYYDESGRLNRPTKYEIAVARSHKIGGRKYNTKRYGGGIVFQSYYLNGTEQDILRVVAEAEQAEKEN